MVVPCLLEVHDFYASIVYRVMISSREGKQYLLASDADIVRGDIDHFFLPKIVVVFLRPPSKMILLIISDKMINVFGR